MYDWRVCSQHIGWLFSSGLSGEAPQSAESGEQVPNEFPDVYDENRYRRSQEYTRRNTWFELVVSTVELATLLVFWFLGGFEVLDQLVRRFRLAPVLDGLLYLGILSVGREILTLPFTIYHTFVIEQRYGFNRTTVDTFILDRLKEWLISGLLMAGFALIVLVLFEFFGLEHGLPWICTAAISVILVYLAPTVILPFFFKLSPVPPRTVQRPGDSIYCSVNDFQFENSWSSTAHAAPPKPMRSLPGLVRTSASPCTTP